MFLELPDRARRRERVIFYTVYMTDIESQHAAHGIMCTLYSNSPEVSLIEDERL